MSTSRSCLGKTSNYITDEYDVDAEQGNSSSGSDESGTEIQDSEEPSEFQMNHR